MEASITPTAEKGKIPFQKIIEAIGTINVSIDWDGNEGKASLNEYLAAEVEGFGLEVSLDIYAYAQSEPATYDYPGSFEIVDSKVFVSGITLYNEDGEDMTKWTDEEYDAVEAAIINSINIQ